MTRGTSTFECHVHFAKLQFRERPSRCCGHVHEKGDDDTRSQFVLTVTTKMDAATAPQKVPVKLARVRILLVWVCPV